MFSVLHKLTTTTTTKKESISWVRIFELQLIFHAFHVAYLAISWAPSKTNANRKCKQRLVHWESESRSRRKEQNEKKKELCKKHKHEGPCTSVCRMYIIFNLLQTNEATNDHTQIFRRSTDRLLSPQLKNHISPAHHIHRCIHGILPCIQRYW